MKALESNDLIRLEKLFQNHWMIYIASDVYNCSIYKPLHNFILQHDIIKVLNTNIQKGVQFFINIDKEDELKKLYQIKSSDMKLANELAEGLCKQYKEDTEKFIKELNDIYERLR